MKILVLDEADRLFAKETEELAQGLVESAPASCTRVLVSATIPEKLRRELRPMLRNAAEVSPLGETVLSSDIEHWCFYCDGRKRLDFARRFEAAVHPARCLLFLSAASRVEKAALALQHLGLPVEGIHSGLDKESRRVALERFASGELRYLLTSDLGARGLDIAGISHVISLDLPEEPTIYTHRAGRTGRAGAKGVSIVLADGVELARASKLATRGGFVFRCKVLEEGQVLEPTAEEFFARAEAAESQRMEAKASKVREGEGRSGPPRRSAARPPRPSERSAEGPRRGGDRDALRERDSSRPAPVEPPEAPRTARAPKSAPWRPGQDMARKDEATGPRLRKKAEIERAAKAEPRPETPEARPELARGSAPRGGSRTSARSSARESARVIARDKARESAGRRESFGHREEDRGRGAYGRGPRDHGPSERSSSREGYRKRDATSRPSSGADRKPRAARPASRDSRPQSPGSRFPARGSSDGGRPSGDRRPGSGASRGPKRWSEDSPRREGPRRGAAPKGRGGPTRGEGARRGAPRGGSSADPRARKGPGPKRPPRA